LIRTPVKSWRIPVLHANRAVTILVDHAVMAVVVDAMVVDVAVTVADVAGTMTVQKMKAAIFHCLLRSPKTRFSQNESARGPERFGPFSLSGKGSEPIPIPNSGPRLLFAPGKPLRFNFVMRKITAASPD
jgi:hypothetical protein